LFCFLNPWPWLLLLFLNSSFLFVLEFLFVLAGLFSFLDDCLGLSLEWRWDWKLGNWLNWLLTVWWADTELGLLSDVSELLFGSLSWLALNSGAWEVAGRVGGGGGGGGGRVGGGRVGGGRVGGGRVGGGRVGGGRVVGGRVGGGAVRRG